MARLILLWTRYVGAQCTGRLILVWTQILHLPNVLWATSTLLSGVLVVRLLAQVREWAEAEKAAVEAWCTEQRQASAREKRAALKQVRENEAVGVGVKGEG